MKTYKLHGCHANHRTSRTFLKCAIPRAAWIAGTGNYAVIAWCRTPTITLHQTENEARVALNTINADACGGRCNNRHDIVKVDM